MRTPQVSPVESDVCTKSPTDTASAMTCMIIVMISRKLGYLEASLRTLGCVDCDCEEHDRSECSNCTVLCKMHQLVQTIHDHRQNCLIGMSLRCR
jgi:hypothetical protein